MACAHRLRAMNLYTISPGTPFLPALVDGVLSRHYDPHAPELLARVTILVPTRRAARALVAAFAAKAGPGAAFLLPRIMPIGDTDEEALAFDPAGPDDEAIAPAMPPLRRQLLLAREIANFDEVHGGEANGAIHMALAGELAQLIDNFHAEGTDTSLLAGLVENDLATHWQKTLDFLAIALKHWPQILDDARMIDAGRRRDLLLARMAERIAQGKMPGPVIAAGSTGTQPATAALLKAVAEAGAGAVVLPGLDLALDAESFDAVPPTHPQYALKALLARLGATRKAVAIWAGTPEPAREAARAARERLIAEALRPPETTHLWHEETSRYAERLRDGFASLSLIEAAHAREESAIIALSMREMLETEGATAALVTADRMLARRVAAELRRWNVAVDDSAGLPLIKTPPGALAMLALEAIGADLSPVRLLALLKNRLVQLSMPPGKYAGLVRLIDRKVMRGIRPAPGMTGLREAVMQRVTDVGQRADLLAFATTLEAALAPLAAVASGAHDVAAFATALASTVEALTRSEAGEVSGFARESGEALQSLLTGLADEGARTMTLTLAGFMPLLGHLARTEAVRPRGGLHPRLSIWGPLEARLLTADLVIIGGLNEGVWPRMAEPDAFLSRPMREKLGLPQPERRIGQSAHDFAMLANAGRVLMTRARRDGDGPANPSRFVLRLKAIADCLGKDQNSPLHNAYYTAWANMQDAPARVVPEAPPRPRPPLAARPRRFSVTEIETHLRDPYAIYARHVLSLSPLDDIEMAFDARLKGNALHNAIEEFTRRHDALKPDERGDFLRDEVRKALGAAHHDPAIARFWLPRLDRAIGFFLAWDQARRAKGVRVIAEVKGSFEIAPKDHQPVEIRGRADRIELAGGKFAIFDYKSGSSPTVKVARAFQPQVQLLALMAMRDGMAGIAGTPVELGYLELKGGKTPGEEKILFGGEKSDIATEITRVTAELLRLIARFDDPLTPYLSRRRVRRLDVQGDFDHLARASAFADGAEGGE